MSLSDTFAKENIYSFTVFVMPQLDSYEKLAKTGASSLNNEKNKVERKGSIKILKIHRNSRAELRIWPSSKQVMKSFTNDSFVLILSNRERIDY